MRERSKKMLCMSSHFAIFGILQTSENGRWPSWEMQILSARINHAKQDEEFGQDTKI
jgi:hypothetical protein